MFQSCTHINHMNVPHNKVFRSEILFFINLSSLLLPFSCYSRTKFTACNIKAIHLNSVMSTKQLKKNGDDHTMMTTRTTTYFYTWDEIKTLIETYEYPILDSIMTVCYGVAYHHDKN